MKKEISTPVAIIIAVVVVAIIAMAGWKWINREPTVTDARIEEARSGSDAVLPQLNGTPPASRDKAGHAQMLNDAQ